jgi:hypothetical protein
MPAPMPSFTLPTAYPTIALPKAKARIKQPKVEIRIGDTGGGKRESNMRAIMRRIKMIHGL